MQSQFEMNIFKYQIYSSPFLMYGLYIIRNPSRFEVVDLFEYLRDIVKGFIVTFIHSWVRIQWILECRTGSILSSMFWLASYMTFSLPS